MRKHTKQAEKATKTALAAKLGVSRQTLSYHVKAGDAPPLSDVDGWRVYLASKCRTGALPADLRRAIGEQRLAILKATRARLEHENEVAAGKTMLCEDACRQSAVACGYLFSELERWLRELPPAISGLDTVSVYKTLRSAVEALRKSAKEKFEEVGQ